MSVFSDIIMYNKNNSSTISGLFAQIRKVRILRIDNITKNKKNQRWFLLFKEKFKFEIKRVKLGESTSVALYNQTLAYKFYPYFALEMET